MYAIAMELGETLARSGFTVCNGGYGGIMEASSRGARNAGGKTIGVLCSFFSGRPPHPWSDELHMTDSLLARLEQLITLGDGYIILKGGTGTLLEFAAVWELMNKKFMHEKPIVLLGRYWDNLVDTLREELAWEGLEDCTRYVRVAESPADAVRILREKLLTS